MPGKMIAGVCLAPCRRGPTRVRFQISRAAARHSGLRHDLACLERDDRSGCLLSGRTINRRENGKAMPWKWSTLLVIVKSLPDEGERYVVTQSLGCGESSVWPCSRDRQRAGAEGHWWESTVRHDYHL